MLSTPKPVDDAPLHLTSFDPRAYGARGDGVTLDTLALQRTIDACNAAGGGRLILSAGTFVSGTLHLCSNLEIHVAGDAVLLGAPDKNLYSGPAEDPKDWLHAFLLGENLRNVAFTGTGVINGNNVFDPTGEEKMRGPHLIILWRCQGVTLRDLKLRDAANYAFFFFASERVRVDNTTFEGGWDGIHFRDVKGAWNRDVQIKDCTFATGDDAIAGACIEDVSIRNCLVNSSCNGVRIIGPVRRWEMTQCRFQGPGRFPHRLKNRFNMLAGVLVQPGAWGGWPGQVENVRFADLEMDGVQCAFQIAVKKGNTGERIVMERIRATLSGPGETASSVESWNTEPLREIVCRDISIVASGSDAPLANAPLKAPGLGVRDLPASGFYAHRVEGLTLENIELSTRTPDARPPLQLNEVTELVLQEGTALAPRGVTTRQLP